MMTGTIRKMQLMLPVVFVLADGSQVTHELVVDTGFTGGLSLSAEMVEELGIPFFRRLEAELADGKTHKYSAHLAAIVWHRKALEVVTYAIGERPLLGTALLEGNDLFAKFKENENFTLEASDLS